MKQTVISLLCVLVVVAFAGCQRERYEVGNVPGTKTETSPSYSVTAETQPAVKTN